jgi:hypothetical protein
LKRLRELPTLTGWRRQVLAKPTRGARLIPLACGNREHCVLGLIDTGRRSPSPAIDLDEQPQ